MEVPLSPLEFARRARHLYGEREAVVDGEKRFTYEQFLERCDRWSAALQDMGVRHGDRVAYMVLSQILTDDGLMALARHNYPARAANWLNADWPDVSNCCLRSM